MKEKSKLAGDVGGPPWGLFAVVGIQRSGTTALATAIAQHPDVEMWPEVFYNHPNPYENFFQHWTALVRSGEMTIHPEYEQMRRLVTSYIDRLYATVPQKRMHGLAIKYDQFEHVPNLRNYLRELNMRVIHIIRNDVLEIVLSQLTLAKRIELGLGAHVGVDEEGQAQRITVPKAADMAYLISTTADFIRQQIDELSKYFTTCDVIYERAFSSDRAFKDNLSRAFVHIGLPKHDLYPTIKKSSPRDYHAYVSNAEEVDRLIEMLSPRQRYVFRCPV